MHLSLGGFFALFGDLIQMRGSEKKLTSPDSFTQSALKYNLKSWFLHKSFSIQFSTVQRTTSKGASPIHKCCKGSALTQSINTTQPFWRSRTLNTQLRRDKSFQVLKAKALYLPQSSRDTTGPRAQCSWLGSTSEEILGWRWLRLKHREATWPSQQVRDLPRVEQGHSQRCSWLSFGFLRLGQWHLLKTPVVHFQGVAAKVGQEEHV